MNNPHQVRTVKCAHCGTVRQEANHWFVVVVAEGRFRCVPLMSPAGADTRTRSVLSRGLRTGEKPVCGQQCAQKVFEQYLAEAGLNRSRRSPHGESALAQ